MPHKNHIEYIKKELDFLQQLIVRFQSQEQVAGIELDIALQKAQNVYEQLLRLRLHETSLTKSHEAEIVSAMAKKTTTQQDETATKAIQSTATQPINVIESKPVHAEKAVSSKPVENVTEQSVIEKKDFTEPTKENTPQTEQLPVSKPGKKVVLGETIRQPHQPINETLAQRKSDVSSRLQSAPLTTIVSGIGLNDRFLYIRELFQGNADLYHQTVEHLEQVDSLNDALLFIDNQFKWDKENEAVQKFLELVARRHQH